MNNQLTKGQLKIFNIILKKIGLHVNVTSLILSYLPESSIFTLGIAIGQGLKDQINLKDRDMFKILTRDYTQFFDEDGEIIFPIEFAENVVKIIG